MSSKNKSEEIRNKNDLFEIEKEKIYLDKKDKENLSYAEKRHKENTATFNTIMTIIKLPYILGYKLPKTIISKITFKSTREAQQKEIARLKRLNDSKERARNSNVLKELEFIEAFKNIGFKDKLNKYPVFNGLEIIGDRETISFKSNLSLTEWISKKEQLETVLNTNIVSVRQGENKQIVDLDTTKNKLPKLLNWDDDYLINDGIFPIGKDIFGNIVKFEFIYIANILVGGAPRGGKTKLFQLLSYQILKTGGKLIIAEFKGVDYQKFENKCQVINDHQELLKALKDLRKEMEKRKKLFRNVGAENIDDYNQKTGSNLKRYYLLIDELGEAMEIVNPDLDKKTKDNIEKDIAELCKSGARLYSAFGIHFVFGTQRPDVRVIEGQTRDQFIGRICFKAVKNTSNIVLESDIASNLNSDDKGRAYIKIGADYKEVQVFLFNDDMLKNLKNKKLTKNDLKIVGAEKENTFDEKEIETIDIDID
ncbi:hypothetical protein M0P65_06960 [Candidatus Gracilibacteria bacterium]|jgi:S-DNA-T family DNA segregation ATPase FtsK/SpoIIIE|nr:hypothetical protein [Candidatus Gracilibacteria bacterium]